MGEDMTTELPTIMYNMTLFGNWTGNRTVPMFDEDSWTIKYLKILWQNVTPTLFFLITIVGAVGNGLVAYVIISNKTMQTTTNLLLLNLAFADIAYLLICVPFTTYKYFAAGWPFGQTFCKITKYFGYVSVYITIWTLVCISLLRFMTVLYSHGTLKFRTKRNVTILNISIWTIMTIVNVPVLLISRVRSIQDYSFCGSDTRFTKALFLTFFVFTYALPLTIITVLYMMIVIYLRRHSNTTLDKGHGKGRTARATKMIILVIVVFMLSWLPSHVQSMYALDHNLPQNAVYLTLQILWECMSFANACANPIIYNFGSQDFRKCFRQIVCCEKIAYWKMRKASRSTRNTNGTTTTSSKEQGTTVDTRYFL